MKKLSIFLLMISFIFVERVAIAGNSDAIHISFRVPEINEINITQQPTGILGTGGELVLENPDDKYYAPIVDNSIRYSYASNGVGNVITAAIDGDIPGEMSIEAAAPGTGNSNGKKRLSGENSVNLISEIEPASARDIPIKLILEKVPATEKPGSYSANITLTIIRAN
jgi:hypothetical protein